MTTITLNDESYVCINDKRERADTTECIIRELASKPVKVSSHFDVPIGSGFGASAAGALSTALALNKLLSLGMTANELGMVAHVAEVKCRTGLGDVIAQVNGGVVIRRSPGGPGTGLTDLIPIGDVEVGYIVLGSISTRSILEDEKMKKRINTAGRNALKELLKRPTFINFVRLSKEFALEIELVDERAKDMITIAESRGGFASMVMLGNVVFAIPPDVLSGLGDVKISGISHQGARLL